MPKDLVTATEAFWTATKDGRGELISAGSVHAADSAVVKANRDKFKTQEELSEQPPSPTFGPTEQATQAPGEKRAAVKKSNEGPTKGLTTDQIES